MKRKILILLLALCQLIPICLTTSCAQTQDPATTADEIPTVSLTDFVSSLTSETDVSPTDSPRVGVSGVVFDQSAWEMRSGERSEVRARVIPENATNQKIVYTVSDPTVCSYENGVLTALSEGCAVLTAQTDEDGYIARLQIVVSGAAPTIDPPVTVSPTDVSPSTEPSPTPTVVTPTAKKHVSGVTVDETALVLTEGESRAVNVRVLPDDADDKSFRTSSSAPDVVKYEGGVLTALSEGAAVVTFTSNDGGFTAKISVTVKKKSGGEIPNAFRYDENGLPRYTPAFDPEIEYYDFNPVNTYHLFCHNLVAFEDKDDYFYSDCITVKEFKRILEQLYERDYILIDIDYMYEYSYNNGLLNASIKKNIKLPKGKKAIILSVDNVCYPRGEHGRGRCDRLQVVDGKLMTYTKLADGTDYYSDDNEVFTILENFVAAHPDFSFAGAKCVVAPSGYEGLFGWDTVPGSENYDQSVAECKKIVKWFNDHGYAFACHSYYHKDFKTMTVEQIANDRKHWMEECYPIIGRTHIFIYPFGSFTEKNSDQAKALNEAGYAVFCATSYYAVNWNNFPLPGNCYNERVTLASKLFAQKYNDPTLAKLFDVFTVYENEAHKTKLYRT